MFSLRRMILVLGILAACAALVAPAGVSAETLLIAVRETVDGRASQPPLPADEGVSTSLFEKGHIVFDTGNTDAQKNTTDLTEDARTGGAAWLLRVEVTYTQKQLDQGAMRVDGQATFTLIDSATGATSLAGTVTASNKGREKNIDRQALGMELGRLVTDRVTKAIPAPAM